MNPMTGSSRNATRVGLGCASLAALLTLVSCGDSLAPTASDQSTPEPAAKRRVSSGTVASSDLGSGDGFIVERADKGVRSITVSIGPAGGRLVVGNAKDKTKDDLRVAFIVPEGALTQTAEITMNVTGEILSDLVVDFEPSGLRFSPWASLHITIGTDRVDFRPKTLAVVHISSTASEEIVDSIVRHKRESDVFNIWTDVPGFSRYGLRRR
jgi:hypothetical protein